jgi:hypothetical protein
MRHSYTVIIIRAADDDWVAKLDHHMRGFTDVPLVTAQLSWMDIAYACRAYDLPLDPRTRAARMRHIFGHEPALAEQFAPRRVHPSTSKITAQRTSPPLYRSTYKREIRGSTPRDVHRLLVH